MTDLILQDINIGTNANDKTGDKLKVGGDKINSNNALIQEAINNINNVSLADSEVAPGTYVVGSIELDTKGKIVNLTPIHNTQSKISLVDADELPLLDSASSFSLKKINWGNLKSMFIDSLNATLTILSRLTPAANKIPYFIDSATAGLLTLDSDNTLSANSDTNIPTQKAVKTFMDNIFDAKNVMIFKGNLDCSTFPNYPSANAGHTYRVSAAGKIGGPAGLDVEIGDILLCTSDQTTSGTQSTSGAYWGIIQTNVDGLVIGPGSSTVDNLALFANTTGKLIKEVTPADARTLLSLIPGINVQVFSPKLLAIANIDWVANSLLYLTGSGTVALATLTSFARTFLATNNQVEARTLIDAAAISTPNVFTKSQAITPVVNNAASGIITPDAQASNNFRYTLTGNLVLNNPTNPRDGQLFVFKFKQDFSGNRLITLPSKFRFTNNITPVFSKLANSVDMIIGYYDASDDQYQFQFYKGFG